MKNYILIITSLVGLGVALYIAMIAALALAFQWAWNYALPELFHLPSLGYGQAVALLTLVTLVALLAKGVKLKADFKGL